ncbi:MAG: hypothetical protein M3Y22_02055 [Pseudomonadota bacterium]|nr:hypothetical protein [Pseudomonadota bacterium]
MLTDTAGLQAVARRPEYFPKLPLDLLPCDAGHCALITLCNAGAKTKEIVR